MGCFLASHGPVDPVWRRMGQFCGVGHSAWSSLAQGFPHQAGGTGGQGLSSRPQLAVLRPWHLVLGTSTAPSTLELHLGKVPL